MKRELFRAKHIYSDIYMISESMKWFKDMLYLLNGDTWIECEPKTRSVSYPNMIDKNGKKIFASISEINDILKEYYDTNKKV